MQLPDSASATGVSPMEGLRQTLTAPLTAHEVVEVLDDSGVEWYVSESGDLFVRYWQLAAENFAEGDMLNVLRDEQQEPGNAGELEWLSANFGRLQQELGGSWIAVARGNVIAASDSLAGLLAATEDAGAQEFLITQLALPEEVVWKTAYAG